ncbi:MAG: hypothetical protein KAV87_68800, partial [Desulfobacteraceae bacterium]|nr:hypothetical protein [Desulfobacteraceae bacterium]
NLSTHLWKTIFLSSVWNSTLFQRSVFARIGQDFSYPLAQPAAQLTVSDYIRPALVRKEFNPEYPGSSSSHPK